MLQFRKSHLYELFHISPIYPKDFAVQLDITIVEVSF